MIEENIITKNDDAYFAVYERTEKQKEAIRYYCFVLLYPQSHLKLTGISEMRESLLRVTIAPEALRKSKVGRQHGHNHTADN